MSEEAFIERAFQMGEAIFEGFAPRGFVPHWSVCWEWEHNEVDWPKEEDGGRLYLLVRMGAERWKRFMPEKWAYCDPCAELDAHSFIHGLEKLLGQQDAEAMAWVREGERDTDIGSGEPSRFLAKLGMDEAKGQADG